MNVMEIIYPEETRLLPWWLSRYPPRPSFPQTDASAVPSSAPRRPSALSSPLHGQFSHRAAPAKRGCLAEGRTAHPPAGPRRLRGRPGRRRRLRSWDVAGASDLPQRSVPGARSARNSPPSGTRPTPGNPLIDEAAHGCLVTVSVPAYRGRRRHAYPTTKFSTGVTSPVYQQAPGTQFLVDGTSIGCTTI